MLAQVMCPKGKAEKASEALRVFTLAESKLF